MTATSTDYFKKVGSPGTATTLSAPGYTKGGTSMTVGSTTNWSTGTGVCFSVYETQTVAGQTTMVAGSYNEYNGVVSSGTSITSVSHVAGSGTDRDYAAGATTVVTIMVTSGRENDMVDGILVSHDQDGTLKAGAVDSAAVLASSVVEEAKIADLAVTTGKIAASAVNASKIDFSTFAQDASKLLIQSGTLSVSVTVANTRMTTSVTFGTAYNSLLWVGVVNTTDGNSAQAKTQWFPHTSSITGAGFRAINQDTGSIYPYTGTASWVAIGLVA